MNQEELFQATDALLNDWLDRIDWVVVTANSEQRHQALVVKEQVLQAKRKLERRLVERRWLDQKDFEGLENAVRSFGQSLPPAP